MLHSRECTELYLIEQWLGVEPDRPHRPREATGRVTLATAGVILA